MQKKKVFSMSVDEVFVHGSIEFLFNLREHEGSLFFRVRGEPIELSDEDLV